MRGLWLAWLLVLAVGEVGAQELIGRVQMFRDRGGEPGDEVSEFRPQDRKKHFRIELGKLELGRRAFKVRYVAAETAQGSEIEITTADVGSLMASEITAHVELPQDWPLGRYRVELLMDGRVIGTHPYIVTPSWGEQIVGYWTLYSDRGGAQGEAVEVFRSSERVLHFEAQTTGYIKRGAHLTWQLLGPDGDEVVSTEQFIEPDSPIFNILTYQVSFPTDWSTGTYRIQIRSGRRLLGAHEFEIVAR